MICRAYCRVPALIVDIKVHYRIYGPLTGKLYVYLVICHLMINMYKKSTVNALNIKKYNNSLLQSLVIFIFNHCLNI